jgi:hypothetical protein
MKRWGLVVALAGTAVAWVPGAPVVHADGPGVGTPWVVSLGDSYISGEGGRWAGNSNNSSGSVDAGGAAAYYNRCHRSTAAEIHIGGGVNSLNLACSGAKTSTFTSSDGYFKPGIDFYNSGGNQGQALMLQNFAATHNVKMIQLSIGGNNFGFADIIQACVTNFLTSPSWWPNYCYDDSSVANNFTAANVTAQTNAITAAIANVKTAMANAGYSTSQYTIVAQTYPSPIPNGSGFRYSQSGFTRQSTGGCGFWNKDADWANATALVKINNAVKNGSIQRSPPVRKRRQPDGEHRPRQLDQSERRQLHGVDCADPHAVDRVRAVLRAGIAAPELVGRKGAAQLRAAGLQRRRTQGWRVHPGDRAQRQR